MLGKDRQRIDIAISEGLDLRWFLAVDEVVEGGEKIFEIAVLCEILSNRSYFGAILADGDLEITEFVGNGGEMEFSSVPPERDVLGEFGIEASGLMAVEFRLAEDVLLTGIYESVGRCRSTRWYRISPIVLVVGGVLELELDIAKRGCIDGTCNSTIF